MFDLHTFQLQKKDGSFVVNSSKSTTKIGGRKNFQSMATAVRYYSDWCPKDSVEKVVKVYWSTQDLDYVIDSDEEIGYIITYYDEDKKDIRVLKSWSKNRINTFNGFRDAGRVQDWKRIFSSKKAAEKSVSKLQDMYANFAENIREKLSEDSLRYNQVRHDDVQREAGNRGHSHLDRFRDPKIWNEIKDEIDKTRRDRARERMTKKANSYANRELEIKTLVLTHKKSIDLDLLSEMM